jgi:hypothetical protein
MVPHTKHDTCQRPLAPDNIVAPTPTSLHCPQAPIFHFIFQALSICLLSSLCPLIRFIEQACLVIADALRD